MFNFFSRRAERSEIERFADAKLAIDTSIRQATKLRGDDAILYDRAVAECYRVLRQIASRNGCADAEHQSIGVLVDFVPTANQAKFSEMLESMARDEERRGEPANAKAVLFFVLVWNLLRTDNPPFVSLGLLAQDFLSTREQRAISASLPSREQPTR